MLIGDETKKKKKEGGILSTKHHGKEYVLNLLFYWLTIHTKVLQPLRSQSKRFF